MVGSESMVSENGLNDIQRIENQRWERRSQINRGFGRTELIWCTT